MSTRRNGLHAMWLATAIALAGCHASFTTSAPKGFIELDEPMSDFDFRATTADGLVIAVREIDHDPEADLNFWARAVENAMRQRGGYAMLGTSDRKIADGLAARQLRFGHDEASKPHLYLVTLVVTSSVIYVLEAGGDQALVEQRARDIDAWIAGFKAERCAPFPFSFACTAATVDAALPAPAPSPAATPVADTPAPSTAPATTTTPPTTP